MIDYPVGFTAIPITFTTHAATGAAVAPSTAFEVADIRLYRNGSTTPRSSTSGWTISSPLDSVTGLHRIVFDLSDNTDAGFYAAGRVYEAILVSDETVDSLAVVKKIGEFSIGMYLQPTTPGRTLTVESDGMAHADVKEWLGVAPLALTSQLVQAQANQLGTQAKADVNAEADTALADYDPPTHAELVGEVNDVQGDIAGVPAAVWGAGARTLTSFGTLVADIWAGVTQTFFAKFFTQDSGETFGDAVAGSVVKEIADNAGGGSAPTVEQIADEVQTRTIAAVTTVATVTNKVTPIDVDGLTHAKAMEVIMAALLNVATPAGSTVEFTKRDGTTVTLTITYGAADGERTASVIA